MLEKIERIRGIGLLHDVDGRALKLSNTQLIYADNGRGKSTLASVLRSVSSGDAATITERKTVDGTIAPEVALAFGSGHKVTFSNGSWSENRPEVLVFDAEFIEKNVHSGGIVTPGQRKNLLQFALGASAVKARATEELATKASSDANAAVAQITAQLVGYHQGMLLSVFQKLAPNTDSQVLVKIDELQKRIRTAQNIGAVLARSLPDEISEPMFDIDALFGILNTSLKDVEEDAEQVVSAHIKKISNPSIERWISDGQEFDNGSSCPYCDQETDGVLLVRAYKTHFNEAYNELKNKVSVLERGVTARTSDLVIDKIEALIVKANATISAWANDLATEPLNFQIGQAKEDISKLRENLLNLVALKLNRPLDHVGSEQEKADAHRQWLGILQHLKATNAQICTARLQIENYRKGLQTENIGAMNQELVKLQLSIVRGKQEVLDLLSSLVSAKQKASSADAAKKTARATLNTQMETTLDKFQISINKILKKFGAAFSIEKLASSFRSGLRSEYGLSLRKMSITLAGPPKFATALSEGDKRTLAFAFFVAMVISDDDLNEKIVVIDDPMCSLDANRKSQTKDVLKAIGNKAEQIIILAHDPFFIRDMREALTIKGAPILQVIQLRYATDGYSELAKFDVDQECESPFYRHHRMLMEFCSGTQHDSRSVAKAIRPFLEGYLHRRFPGRVPKELMFGQILGHIAAVPSTDPLSYACSLIEELQEINSYAGQFHHDTNPGLCETIPVVSAELLAYGERALTLVYRGFA